MPDNYFPLHPAQQDVYMDQLLNVDSPQYNIGGYIVLKGNLDKTKFHEAVNSAPAIIDSFKMRFDMEGQELLCGYTEDYTRAEIIDLDFSIRNDGVQAAREWMQERFNTPFKLSYESLPFEQFLIKINDQEHWFFGKYHHLITDGYGFIVYVQYVAQKYTSLLSGEETLFSYSQYRDAAIAADAYHRSADYQQDGEYWKEKIPVKPENLLQKKHTSYSQKGTTAATYSLDITGAQREMLENIQQASSAGLQQLTMAALLIYFGKTTSSSEFILGIPIHKRGSRQLRNTVGMFSGILPFKGNYNREQTLIDLLKEISGSQRADYRHQHYLIGDLSRDLKINSGDYLCEVLVNYEPLGFELNFGEEIAANIIRLANESERNPLELCWRDYGKHQQLQLQIQFKYEYFSDEEIELFTQRIFFIIAQFANALDQPIGHINILSAEEETQLGQFNNTAAVYPKGKSIVTLFQEQAVKSPDATAIVFEQEQLSYKELNERSNQLAHYLKKKGVTAETLVPICLERSLEMIIGIMGIMKAGGAYVPIDPAYPADRISYMLDDTGANLVLSSKASKDRISEATSASLVTLDEDWELIQKEKSSNPEIIISSKQLAYVIYTSGSTGKPKGAMNEHGGVVNRLIWAQQYFKLTGQDSVLQKTTFCFDVSVWELLWPLIAGARLVFAKPGGHTDSAYLKSIIDREKITLLHFVPSMLSVFLSELETGDCNGLNDVLCSGEALSPSQVNLFAEKLPEVRLHNLYGPTEAAIDVSYWSHLNKTDIGVVPIGKPVANTQLYILNIDKELIPIGERGELYIGGVQVGRGYLNRAELTEKKFIKDWFSSDPNAKLYRTGDLARWLPDGNIEYLGRMDDQVKIRGYRVELGEIESILNQNPGIQQAIVIAKDDAQGTKQLVGYVVAQKFDKHAVQAWLSEKLPDYMVPAIWVELETIPLTPNGKADKKSLPDPELITAEYIAPRNETELELADTWQKLLGVGRIGIHDNFFELGGHSLSAMRVASAIRRDSNVELNIRDLFVYPTIAGLAEYVNKQNSGILLPALIAVAKPEYIPLSFSQERLWFIDRLEGSVQYHIPAIIRLKGELNKIALEKTLKTIISRHEVLRTVILEDANGSGYQRIMPESAWSLIYEDHTKEDTAEIERHIEQLVKEPFDLSKDYMLRANLLKVDKEQHVLSVTMHHIASDGWSASVLVKEVVELYEAFVESREVNLPELQVQYADYAIWQRNWLRGEALESKLDYWKAKLSGVSPLELPTDYTRPAVLGTYGASIGFSFNKELSESLQTLSQQRGATLFMTVLSAFKVLLYCYSGQEDICVGTPVAGRQQHEVEGLIGFFVNTLALRSQVNGDQSFLDLLKEVKATTLEAYAHQEAPFEKVVDAVVTTRDMSRSPLFQVMFVYQNTPEVPELHLGNTSLSLEEGGYNTSKNDLTFTLNATPQGISGSIQYNTDLYKDETIGLMLTHFKELLGSIAARPDQRIGLLGMLTKSEETTLLHEFNNTEALYPKEASIVSLIEDQVAKTPGRIAITFEEQQLSYKELNEKSNQLARYLIKNGITAETLVPICVERSSEMVIAILGVLKAGAAYVPVDPDYPQDRISYTLEDTGAKLVLSSRASRGKLDEGISVIELDGDWKLIEKEKNDNLETVIDPGQLAYVIYTSGSTGRPKGVMIEHRSTNAFIAWCKNEFADSNFDIVYATTSICFDLSVFELFFPLTIGKPLRILENGLAIPDYLAVDTYVLINTVPSVVESLLNQKTNLGSISVLNMAGEPIPATVSERLDTVNTEVRNLYGPTEDTTYSTIYKLAEGKPVLIGRPISNTAIYILNTNKALAPIGVSGEICIGGAGLARGYLKKPELTAEKFIKDPFNPDARLYKTGDLGRWLSDGNIEYQGRIDDQVKIRGYRIELGEIETVLSQSGLVTQCVILAKTDNLGNKRLVGYIVAAQFDKQAVQAYLSSKLPEYMVPVLWVQLENIPLTPNGKTDKKALPDPELTEITSEYVAPRNETEQAVAEIWQELLGIERAGINDNFFELGGHSLLAMRVISAIRRELNVELNIRDLFVHSNIAGLAAYIDKQNKESALPALKAGDRPEHIPLSFSQERLWFLDRLEGTSQYHVPAVLRIHGELKVEILEQTLRSVINRHEVLRTVMLEDNHGKGYQNILPAYGWSLIVEDDTKNDTILKRHIEELIAAPFDLSADYMLRANLLRTGSQDYMLVVTMHHIASDGWSVPVLVNEVAEIYAAFSEGREAQIASLPVQYADYAIWQRKYLQGELFENKLDYWEKKLNGVSPLELPTDYTRLPGMVVTGASLDVKIGNEVSAQLEELSRAHGATLYMTLLSAFNVLLYRYSGQEDICVGTPVAGRQQFEIEGLIGFFVNTLALRSNVSGYLSFSELLDEVKNITLEAYANQEVPLEKVVDAVVKERDMSRSPLFQVMFVFQNTPDIPELRLGDTTISFEESRYDAAKFDLTLTLTATTQGLSGSLEYNTKLYKAETIKSMLTHFSNLLDSIVASPNQHIGLLPMLNKSEEQTLLQEFNDTALLYPMGKTIVSLIEDQVAKTPGRTAVVFGNEQLTYKTLNEKSNQLARYLINNGITAETLVPICVERSSEMVIAILGVLKAGAAYVPVDPEYPQDRITYTLEDTGAKLVLSSRASRGKLDEGISVIELDGDWKLIEKEKNDNLETVIDPGQLAYVIYTSGSTGRPKGVMIEHRSTNAFIAWCKNEFADSNFDIVYATTSICFDLSVFELFFPLTIGKPLRILENGLAIPDYLAVDTYVLINTVPSVVESLLNQKTNLGSISVLNMAGEPIPATVSERLDTVNTEVRNLYGPTEDTTYSTIYKLAEGKPVLIGRPISNTAIYILNTNKALAPIGVSGEICIGGAGLARGYLKKPELTAEKFIKDPFNPDARLYKTGDLGRWLSDGNIEYQGRIDDQVKIRGYRIELGEIETVLSQSGLVTQCVILAKRDTLGNKRLVGYIVAAQFDKHAVQTYLSSKLPEYMVPALWVELEKIPLTPNGKTDKKALPDPELTEITSEYVAPRNDIEETLADIWKELLGVERVGIYDNFFELGGDSILTIQVVSRLRRLGHGIQPKDIFNHQVIASLSQIIGTQDNHVVGEQGQLTGSFGLLPIQAWYLERADKDVSHFNQSVLLNIDKSVDAEALRNIVKQLVLQHDALRLSFENEGGVWHQTYGNEEGVLVQEDLRKVSSDKLADQINALAENHQKSLSIEDGYLVRMVWMQTPDEDKTNRLLIVIHHLAVDGVSWRILLADIDQLLDGLIKGEKISLGAKSSSYRQWHTAISQYGQSTELLLQKDYWEQAKSKYKALPEDKSYAGEVRKKDMSGYQVKLGAEQTRQLLQDVPKVYHTEINDLLLSALSTTLCKWSGKDQVVIGLEGHGREAISADIDISNTIGWFTSLYPVVLKSGPDSDTLIKGVKEELRRIPGKGIGYGVLKYINNVNELQGEDPWDIVFNYLGQVDSGVVSGRWLDAAKESGGSQVGKDQLSDSKLSVNSQIFGGKLVLNWSYSTKHYNEQTICNLADKYISNLLQLIAHCLEQSRSGQVFTPADYGLSAEIGYEELDRFLEEPYLLDERKYQIDSIGKLSGLQQGMLFHGLYDEGSDAGGYIEQMSCDLMGLEREALLASWAIVIKRHSILRSAFYYDSFSIPVQCVYKDVTLPVEELDYRVMDESARVAALEAFEAADRVKGFDFKAPPLMRLALIRLSDERYRMIWTSHHILFDGWSLPVMMEEFLSAYELLTNGKKVPDASEDRYEDYIRYLNQKDKNKEEQYWRNYLKDTEQGTLLPFVAKTVDRTKGKGRYDSLNIVFDETKTRQVQEYAQANRLTVNTVMQGVWSILLHNYTGDPQVIFGVVVSGRPDDLANVEHRVGMYINTLPLRAHFGEDTNQQTVNWLQGLQEEQVASREYQYTAVQDIQKWTGVKDDLFDCLLTFENYPVSKMLTVKNWQLKIENVQVRAQSNYLLTIIVGTSDELSINFNYNAGLLEAESIESIRDQFEQVLLQITAGSANRLSDIRLLTPAQEHQLLVAFNNSQVSYPTNKTLCELIEERATRHPDTIAVAFEEQQLSYKALNERSNQLAHYLQSKGVKEDILVPLLIERGAEMLIAILGILKAGGAYVPIDTDFPQDRIAYMLEDTKAKVIVTSSTASDKLPQGQQLDIIELDEEKATLRQQSTATPATNLKPQNLAYVIYTSGSTGKPKGVQISHSNITDYVYGLDDRISISESKSFALVSSIATDLGNTVLYGSLLTGGTLHVFSKETVSHIEALHEYFNHHQVDCLKIVPSHWKALMMDGQPLLPRKLIIFGGEALTSAMVETIQATGAATRIVNHYGPTETTIGKLLHEVKAANSYGPTIPIGKPFSNTRTYVLSKEMTLCPMGVPGQLYIAGDGLAKGYLNNEELTKEKFVQNPFGEKGELLYATGDKVQCQPDGNILFIGRVDDQVKIRGYRVEPGEIGRILEQSELVEQAIVLAKEDKQGNKQLVGYIVPKENYDKQQLQAYLKEQLPDYMVPAHLVELESFPLTANGKIDRRALPDPEAAPTDQYTAAGSETETKLKAIWLDVLELDDISVTDDFFELGGHSLLAVRLISLIRKAFGMEIPISDVFDYPTVRQLASRLADETPTEELLPSVKAETRPEYIPLSFSQERMWFIDRLEGSAQYNLPAVLRLKGKLDEDILEKTLHYIIERHEVLRTVIREHDGKGYQQVIPAGKWSLTKTAGITDTAGYIAQSISKPFDFSNDYMLRAELIRLAPEDYILVVTMHHVASDGWSRAILVKEVIELYESFAKGEAIKLTSHLPIQYADYAIWQRRYMDGTVLENKLGYWKTKLDDVATLELPTDFSRPAVQRLRGAMLNFGIEKELSAKVNTLSQQNGATLYMTLLTAFKVLMYRYSGQEDICVGTTVAGRNQQELEGLIGFFINTMALRSQVKGDSSFTALLKEVKQTTLEAYAHQEVPFEKVVDAVVKGRDMSRHPLFQVLFTLQNTPEIPELKLEGLTLNTESQEHNTSRFDIAFMVNETKAGIQVHIEYNTDLYTENRIERMTGHFRELLTSIVSAPETAVGKLTLLTKAEQEEISTFGESQSDYPKDQTIAGLFEAQAAKNPGNIAVAFEEIQISYKSLDERANQLAHYLQSKGVKENTLVPLLLERGADMLIGILGIMKAGGAYVPIDTEFPSDRISYMLENTEATVVVTNSTVSHKLPQTGITVIKLDEERSTLRQQPTTTPATNQEPENLAYIIYTSGSTGKPKGVEISHKNIADYVYGLEERIQISKSKSFALVSSIATDLGNTVLYGSLLTGGTLHVFTKETVSHIEALHEYFDKYEIDCLKIVPSHWKALMLDNQPLLPKQQLIFGGEALQRTVVDTIQNTKTNCKIINHYGPTETTIGKLLHEVKENSSYGQTIPIGKPFSNTKTYILSKELSPSPIGIPGQLYIAGDGLAKGYLNNEALTKEKFVTHPTTKERLYATGDKVQYGADGNITFIGRVDDQVKIRGYRVEPGEIGRILEQSEQVEQAIVLAKDDKQGNKQLIGYIIAANDYDKRELQAYLKEQLPDYMVPSHIVELTSFPLTANGKIDRRALPDPEVTTEGGYQAPQNETEAQLAAIWQDVLELDEISTTDDFFELGGHSLLAVRLISLIRKGLGMELPISDIFDYPTIQKLAERLTAGASTDTLPPVMAETRPEHIPLSFSQERLWFIDRLEGSVQYNQPAVLRLKGKLNGETLATAFKAIINRHEVLRTVILEDTTGDSYQQIMPAADWALVVEDEQDETSLRQHIEQLIAAPFDLSKDYKLRANLVKIDEEEYVLAITLHHIASDGWSRAILVKELVELYSSNEQKRPANLPVLAVQYADYAIWQRKYLQGEVLENKLGYWKAKLDNVSPLQLPTDYSRPAIQSTRGAKQTFNIDRELSTRLQAFSQQNGATLYMTLLSAFKVLLYRYSGQEDICVGTPVAGRSQQEIENLIGFFINTIALRTTVTGEQSFTALLAEVKATTLEAYSHQEVPFEKIVDAVVKNRDMSRSPLFQVMFSLQNTPDIPEIRLEGLTLAAETQDHVTAKFDISFLLTETAEGILGAVEYSTDIYKAETIVQMVNHYQTLLDSIIPSAGDQVGRLRMLSVVEEETLVKEFNDTGAAHQKDKNIIELFEQWAAKSPDTVALVFEKEKLTYKELNERSNQFARYLIKKGATAETLVPICLDRSPEMVVSILAILKTGAAYVPIDPAYPSDRISFMLEDTGAKLVVSSKINSSSLKEQAAVVIEIDNEWSEIVKEQSGNVKVVISPDQLAYIIYTSGSTGKPKGVMVEHKNLLSYLLNNKTKYIEEGSSNAGSFMHLSYTFDASLTGLFMPLLNGKLMVIAGNHLVNVFEDENLLKYAPYDFIKITPAHLAFLPENFRNTEGNQLTGKLVIGGEALRFSQFDLFVKQAVNIEIINEYGPTEATVGCSTFSFNTLNTSEFGHNEVSIGKPIDNTQIYILGGNKELVPIGVTGEICIGGAGITRGYLNRPELTDEKFIKDIFSTESGARLYRTGDLGRWLPDGNIEYQGRVDDQVKVRGYRIELGEIESILNESELVSLGVILAKEDKQGSKRLVGYVVPTGEFDRQNIQNYLNSRLPEYMVPALWVELGTLPLTSNGKIDRKALPDPELIDMSAEYVAPRNETELKLAQIWEQLLGIARAGIFDNFFELGGHSLLAMRVVSAIRRELNTEISIRDIFIFPNIAGLAGHLEEQTRGVLLPAIAAGDRPEHIPLSFSQERLWFIDRLEGSKQYHLPSVLRLRGNLDINILERTLQAIINRHEVLRTVIQEQEGQGYQYIIPADSWKLDVTEPGYKEGSEKLIGFIGDLISRPFDLSEDYMLRANLIKLDKNDYVLVVTMHHIASDGWSTSILVKEVISLYEGFANNTEIALPALEVQYSDYAIWQRKYLSGEVLESKLDYWKTKLEGVTPLQLPTDYTRPVVPSSNGAKCTFKLDQKLSSKLVGLSHQHGATLYMTLLSAFNVLLYRYSSQEDICVGTPIAGRNREEVESLIGFFINTLALRNNVNADLKFSELLEQVKGTTLEAYNNQEVPFEKVVDAVVKTRDMSRSPLFQVLFSLQNTPDVPELKLDGLSLSAEMQGHTTAKFDLAVLMTETSSGISGSIEYSTDLYTRRTIEAMVSHFINLLGSITASAEEKIGRLDMLSGLEEQQVLLDFNATSAAYPKEKSIVDLFEEQVAKNPESTAIIFESRELTYKALNERSNQLARYLQKQGVKADILVPICLERNLEMMIGILGILKAGGAYVPVDPEYPADRITYMLEDTGAKLALSSAASKEKLSESRLQVIELDGDWEQINEEGSSNLDTVVSPDQLAYVIYTSGSTGKPKGAMNEHRGVVNRLLWTQDYFKLSSKDVILQKTTFCFDVSVWELFWPVITGAKLVFAKPGGQADSTYLKSVIDNQKVTLLHFVPSMLSVFLADIETGDCKGLKNVLCSGEALNAAQVQLFREKLPNVKLHNLYGPTEAAIDVSYWSYTETDEITSVVPIGRPVANTQLYILNSNKALCPVGVPGELYIGGVQVGRGYLNRPELTAEKFVEDIFSSDPKARLYRTGDLARWLPDGNIEYLGRVDDQVKIRGYRIELGEIENVLNQNELISQGVVLAREDKQGVKRLVAYVVANGAFDKQAAQAYLGAKLPEYMVPALWVELENIPLTPNGKVNRKALPDPEIADNTTEYVAPRNETEIKLATIWQELLGVERVGVFDNFFELGGHSLLAMRVVSAIRKELSVTIPINMLFQFTSINDLSKYLELEMQTINNLPEGNNEIFKVMDI